MDLRCCYCIILLIQLMIIMVSSQLCPPNCRCKFRNSYQIVNCANTGLKRIPTELIPPDTTVLLLNHNSIENIEELQWLQLRKLCTLDLRGNPIFRIPGNAFRNINNITILGLTADVIDKAAFDGLFQLETLIIDGSRNFKNLPDRSLDPLSLTLRNFAIRDTAIENVDDIFLTDFVRLETVDLRRNLLQNIPFALLKGSVKLRLLLLNNNNISSTNLRFNLTNHPNLKELEIAHNQLESVPYKLSLVLPSLKVLNLSYNRLKYMPNLVGLTHLTSLFLQYNMLTHLNEGQLPSEISLFDAGHNPWIVIQRKAFSSLKNVLVLKLQNISAVDIDLRELIHPMEELDLSLNCELKSYVLPSDFHVKTFNFSQSCLTDFPFLQDNHHSVVHVIDIHGNLIQNLTVNRVVKRTLNASHNNIKFVNVSTEWNIIENLDVGHNNITSVDEVYIMPNVFINFLNFTFNKLKKLTNFYTVPVDLQKKHTYLYDPVKLDFSFNQISNISSDAFHGVPPLTVLKLNNNNISSLHRKLFRRQFHLTKLDLNENHLKGLPDVEVRNLSHLEHLLLDHNIVRDLSLMDFSLLPNLKSLSLSKNPFTELPRDFVFSDIPKFRRLQLENSSLPCECSLTRTMKNIMEFHKNLVVKGHCMERSNNEPRDLNYIMSINTGNPWICGNNCSAQTSVQSNCQGIAIGFYRACQNPYPVLKNSTITDKEGISVCNQLLHNVEIRQSNCSWLCDERKGYLDCFGLSNSFCIETMTTEESPVRHLLSLPAIIGLVISIVVVILVAVGFCRKFCRKFRKTLETDLEVLTEFEAADERIQ